MNGRIEKKTNPFRFALGLFGLTLLTQVFHAYNYSYFVDEMSLITVGMATAAKIIFIFVDGVNDVLFGALSEKTPNTKLGKRLPWLIVNLPFLIIFVLATYLVSDKTGFSQTQFFLYYLAVSILFENSSTIAYVNYGALYPVLFEPGKERVTCASYKHVLEIIGMGICFILTPILKDDLGFGYIGVTLLYGGIYLIIMIICLTGIRHPNREDAIATKPYSFIQTVKDIVHNKPFLLYQLAQSFFQAILGLLLTIYPMYCKYVLNITTGIHQAILIGCLFVSVLFSMFFWNYFIAKKGYRKCWLISYAILPFAMLLLGIANNYNSGLVMVFVLGPFVGGLMITPDLMSSELIDIDKKKNGVAREASFYSIGTLIQRISLAISAVVFLIVSLIFNYQDGQNPGENPVLMFRIMVSVVLPLLAAIGAFLASRYIKMTKKEVVELKIDTPIDSDN